MSSSFKKNEVAKILGLKKSTIRYYEEVGLISPLVDTNNYREYGMMELKLLSQINFLRTINLDIGTIKQVIYDDTFDSYDVLSMKKKELNDLIKELNDNIRQIDEILKFLDSTVNSHDYQIVEIPKRYLYNIKTASSDQEDFYKENKEFFQKHSLSIGDWFIKTVDIENFLGNGHIDFNECIEVKMGKGKDFIFLPKGKYICFTINFDNDEPINWDVVRGNFKEIIAKESYTIRESEVLFLNKDNLNLNLSDLKRTISVQVPII
ncbi:MAG: MerR family transcriptional regulator [Clostridiales bacterium]|nr:MerR family transcriptional regulator [Clostridiales bacterium]